MWQRLSLYGLARWLLPLPAGASRKPGEEAPRYARSRLKPTPNPGAHPGPGASPKADPYRIPNSNLQEDSHLRPLPRPKPAAVSAPIRNHAPVLNPKPVPLTDKPAPDGRLPGQTEVAASARPHADADLGGDRLAPDTFRDWAAQVLRKLDALHRQASWTALERLADEALRITARAPRSGSIWPPGAGKEYEMALERYRDAARLEIAHEAWRRGELDKAVSMYQRAVAGTRGIWGGARAGEQGATGTTAGVPALPEVDSGLGLAGVRLALWGSRQGERDVELIGSLPRRAKAELARLEGSGAPSAGEGILRKMLATAVVIDRFLREEGLGTDGPPDRLPTVLPKDPPAVWMHAAHAGLGLQQWLLVRALLATDTPAVLVRDSAFGRWVCLHFYRAAAPWLAAAVVLAGAAAWLGADLLS